MSDEKKVEKVDEKVKLENTTDAAITLPLSQDQALVVPRAVRKKVTDKATGDDRIEVTRGTADIDAARWAELKKNKVVAGYLKAGYLVEANGSGPPPAPGSAKPKVG